MLNGKRSTDRILQYLANSHWRCTTKHYHKHPPGRISRAKVEIFADARKMAYLSIDIATRLNIDDVEHITSIAM